MSLSSVHQKIHQRILAEKHQWNMIVFNARQHQDFNSALEKQYQLTTMSDFHHQSWCWKSNQVLEDVSMLTRIWLSCHESTDTDLPFRNGSAGKYIRGTDQQISLGIVRWKWSSWWNVSAMATDIGYHQPDNVNATKLANYKLKWIYN